MNRIGMAFLLAATLGAATQALRAQTRVDTLYVRRDPYFQPKDEGTAFLWSFFFPGAGQMYAGETGKGVALAAASNVGFVAMVVGLVSDPGVHSCTQTLSNTAFPVTVLTTCPDSRAPENGLAIAGATMWLGSWIYSMADAGPAVRRYNDAHSPMRLKRLTIVPTMHSLTVRVSLATP